MTASSRTPEGPAGGTRAALVQAAQRLFRELGVEATTIRQIAEAAHVTERTFYRYFDGKEELLAGEALTWIDRLREEIRDRPAQETPFWAVRRAMVGLAERMGSADIGTFRLWMFSERPAQRPLLPRASTRPLVRLELAVAEGIRSRPAGAAQGGGDRFAADLLARVASAMFRSAVIRHRQLVRLSEEGSPGLATMLEEAFDTLIAVVPGRA